MKRRRLNDLYVTGAPFRIELGDEFEEVWLQKLNPIDHERAIRAAGAARARRMAAARDEDSDEYQSTKQGVAEFSERSVLIDLLAQSDLLERTAAIEAELSDDSEWSKDNYLQGLFDAWQTGVSDRYQKDDNATDAEAQHVFNELQRFNDFVQKRLDSEKEAIVRDLEDTSDEELVERASKLIVERVVAQAFMDEYEVQELLYAVREADNHRKYYFGTRADVDDLQPEVKEQLLQAYHELIVEPLEGKGSGETQASSSPSDKPAQLATVPSSGPETSQE